MKTGLKDRYGSTDDPTGYEGQERPGSRMGFSYSAWSLGLGVVFLVALCVWVFARSGNNTDPAPRGSAGTGIVRESGPSSVKD
jgi:hypothetical protein